MSGLWHQSVAGDIGSIAAGRQKNGAVSVSSYFSGELRKQAWDSPLG